MPGERTGTIGEVEPDVGRQSDDVGSVAVAIGNEGDTRGRTHVCDPAGPGQVGVGHRHVDHPAVTKMVDAGLDRAVEAPARLPHHECAPGPGPFSHIVVVAHDGHRQRRGRLEHPCRHRPGQCRAFRRAQRVVEASLRLVERFDGHEHRPRSQSEARADTVLSGVGHLISVGNRWSYAAGGASA
jgi:hypothetical protein